jgi:hypothetical protein
MSIIDQLIEILRSFQKRKGMYVYPVNARAVQNFLHGFEASCSAFGFKFDRELWWTVGESRGWKRAPEGPARPMGAKGLSEDEIMDELIEIEIDTLREQGKRATQPDAAVDGARGDK